MEHGLLGWLVTRALLSSLFVGIFSNNGAITSLLRQTPWSFASKDIGQELLEKICKGLKNGVFICFFLLRRMKVLHKGALHVILYDTN